MDIISLKCDYCFKEWLSNETVRRYFISDVLDIPVEDIKSVRFSNTFLWKRYRRQKQGILDVLVELNDNTKINIEMQTTSMSCWDKRNLFYLAKMYTEDLKVGEKYSKLKRCICISLLDYKFTKGDDYHTIYRLRDEKGNEFSDVFEIHVIELGKKLKGTEKVDDWIRLINAKSTEDLRMIQAKNIGIKTAIEEMKRMSLSKKLRYHYEAYLKEKRDAWAIADYQEEQRKKAMERGRSEGLAQGREQGLVQGREQGLAQGREQGLKQGIEQGLVEGEERKLVALVCKKLKKGKIEQTIAEELEENQEIIESICKAATKLAPDYDYEKVYITWKSEQN